MLLEAEIIQLQYDADEAVKKEVMFELQNRMRGEFLKWAGEFDRRFFMAAYSAVNGAWDDVRKDIRRGKITHGQAFQIVDKLLSFRLIVQSQADWNKAQFKTVEREA